MWEFAKLVNNKGETTANAVLTADIDLNPGMEINDDGTVTGNPEEWTPIGTSYANAYIGTFNGNGHTISGLYINSSSDNYQGLFGYVDTGGTVKDLSVSGSVSVSGSDHVGGIVGYNSFGTVTNCAFSGSVSGSDHVGGVVGYNFIGGSVTNSYNTGAVSGGEDVGGVVGYNDSGIVENCYNIGKVTGSADSSNVGGVVGQNSDISIVTNCYNTGTVSGPDSGTSNSVGGVVGYNGGSVTNSYNTGSVKGDWYVGGVVGQNSSNAGVENCYNTGKVSGSGNSDVGGVVGYNEVDGIVANCYFLQGTAEKGIGSDIGSGEEIGATAEPVDNLDELCEKFKDTTNTWSIHPVLGRPVLNENKEGGLGTKASPYQISNADELKNFATAVNDGSTTAHAKLMNNIDLSSVCGESNSWIPIGNSIDNSYEGTFNGDGHTISGLYIDSDDNDYKGLFGCLDQGGTVKDLSVSGSVKGGGYVGGVVGLNSGSVENCHNTGTVTGTDDYVGGVVGQNRGSVTNCYNTGTGTVTGTDDYVGGVVGYNNEGRVENSYNTGAVSGSGGYVGGVVGDNRGTVKNCYYQIDKGATVGSDGTTADDTTTVAKTAAEFHSGEVAYLLQKGQPAESGQVWGQTLGGEEDSLPTLVALNPDAAKEVYQLTFDWRYEGAPEGTTTTTNVYTNGSVTIPEINHDRAGYHISGWKDASGAPVTTETAVTADTIYTAEWTANTYTITVTAGSGGAVSGGGTFAEGTQVTVTATANDGYTFVAWQEGGTKIENAGTSYTYTVNGNRSLTAVFEKDEEPEPTPTPTPDPTPSGPSTGDSSGWDDIRDELENTAKGDQITIDMGDETKVPAEIFESLAGKDVDVTFDLGDIQWSVNGADIPTDTDFTDLDLGVNLDTHGIPVNVINTITGEVGTVQITLAHNGEFGFTMTLTAPLGEENAGYWANLYHYDEDAEALNFEAAAKIDEDGSVTIPFSHASQYAIVIDTHSHATVDVSDLFIDIARDAWYKDAVQYAYDNGLMTGVSATEFAPEATTTRAMIVSILARLERVTTAQAAGFADVDDNDWYATAVNWAANVGVVNGYEDNTFRPNTAITREQLAAILMNYAAYKGEDVSNRADLTSYTDQPSTWAQEAMQWAVAEGLISGVTADTLQPQGAATRAQVAAILQRFLSE